LPKTSLRERKQQVVREAIFHAAVALFVERGFDETRVDEIAKAAGVSRASFFRYFESKDDLLAQNISLYGAALAAALRGCGPEMTRLDALRRTVAEVGQQVESQASTRQVIEIAMRSRAARLAHLSRVPELEAEVALAWAERLGVPAGEVEAQFLGNLTAAVMNTAILCWHRGDAETVGEAAERVLSVLTLTVAG
jgi:AcrR family transcriptional regulator